MIQRIQTIYLILSGIAGIMMLFIGFGVIDQTVAVPKEAAGKVKSTTLSWHISANGIEVESDGKFFEEESKEITEHPRIHQLFKFGKTGIIALSFLSFIAIFLYKNRKRQAGFILFALLINLVAMGIMVAGGILGIDILEAQFPAEIRSNSTFSFSPAAGYFMPAAAIAFLFLARRGVKRDEKLIKSIDRIR
jgi:hypothetical protein